jgi:hypothetical protein
MLSDAMHPLKGAEAILVVTEATEEGVAAFSLWRCVASAGLLTAVSWHGACLGFTLCLDLEHGEYQKNLTS